MSELFCCCISDENKNNSKVNPENGVKSGESNRQSSNVSSKFLLHFSIQIKQTEMK